EPFRIMTKKRIFQWAGVLVIAGVIIAMNLVPFNQWLEAFQELLNDIGSNGRLLFICIGTLAVLLFVPVSVPVTVAGIFFGFPGGFIPALSVLGAGAAGGFFVGRLLWPGIKELPLFDRPVFQAVRQALERDGTILLALLRMTPVMHFMTSNLFFGSLNIRFWPYLLSSLLGMIPGTLLLVYAGSVASSMIGSDENVSFWQWGLFGAGLLLFALISWRVSIKTRKILKDGNEN
ncbi:MAG TPA: VTT domain-containing protein, partial [Tichowtungia sp.]|nr:VTT domain-containing protein [Tichowtungia sp.]